MGKIDLAVIHYPRISNFTDFDVFEQMPEVSVRYVTNVRELGTPDLIFLPGSKNTMGDLKLDAARNGNLEGNGLKTCCREKFPFSGSAEAIRC